MGTYKK